MKDNYKKKIRENFNKAAQTYDTAALVQMKIAKSFAKKVPAIIAKSVLELGAGTGLFTREIISAFPNALINITDIAPNMVEMCRKQFSEITYAQFMCLDAEECKLTTSYDLILSCMALHWLDDLKKGISNIISNLNCNGQFVFAALGENSLYEWKKICEMNHYPIATPPFISYEMLKTSFPEMILEKESFQQRYNNSYEFLQSMKLIGAATPNQNHRSLLPGAMRKIFKKYATPIDITYEIIYGTIKNG